MAGGGGHVPHWADRDAIAIVLVAVLAVLLAALLAALLFTPVAARAAEGSAATAPVDVSLQSVDTTAWPKVRLRVVLPARMLTGTLATRDFSLRENGADIDDIRIQALEKARPALDVLLVIDTSGSMRGQALADAKAAAVAFVSGLGPSDRVSVMSFSDRPTVEVGFTTDRTALAAAIADLKIGGWTALYDALVAGAKEFSASAGTQRAIVLLSDGNDSVSGATADTAMRSLSVARIPVYSVAIKSPDLDLRALRSLTKSSGGRLVEVGATSGLAAVFGDIATELTRPYEVTFTSLQPPSKELELDLLVTTRDGRAGLSAAVPNPDALVSVARPGDPVELPSSIWPVALGLLVFLAVGSIVAAVLFVLRPEPNALGQLVYYEQLKSGSTVPIDDEQDVDPESARGRLTRLAGSVASRGGFETAIRHALELAGLPLRPVEYMTLHVSLVLVTGFAVGILTGRMIAAGLTVIALALVPVLILVQLGRRRQAAFQEQLPDVLNLLASSLRAGWGLLQATGIVVKEMGPPVGKEFERVVTEARLGLSLEDALIKMADRVGSEDFKWAVTAIAIQREVGGNLAEVLDLVADTIRERASLHRQIESLTAEGRLSAIILSILPFFEAVVLWWLNPSYFSQLLSSAPGMVAAVSAVGLLLVGIVWLQRIVHIEV